MNDLVKWFHFSQNNSGGYFVNDENVCEEVFIQAHDAKEAIFIAEMFMDNSDSCPCCGDRWDFWVDDKDGISQPEMYGVPLSNYKPLRFTSREKAILHYLDGKKETVFFKANESES